MLAFIASHFYSFSPLLQLLKKFHALFKLPLRTRRLVSWWQKKSLKIIFIEWAREVNNDKILTHVKSIYMCSPIKDDGEREKLQSLLKKTSFISLHFRTIINLFRLSKMSFYFIYVFSSSLSFSSCAWCLLKYSEKYDSLKILLWIIFTFMKNW